MAVSSSENLQSIHQDVGVGVPLDGAGFRLVNLKDVVKVYESPAGNFTALKGINLQIDTGEFVAVVGKSGSGKSTLMNMVTGIDRPTSGEVFVDDIGIHQLSEGKIAIWRGRTVGIVFQFFQLLPTLTVIENIMLPMDFCHMYSLRERRERAQYLLEQVELGDQSNKLPSALSGGQQQRVAIARALANDPPIIVADEPTGNLDSSTADSVFRLFEELIRDGKTILMVTHDQDMAQKVSRTIYLVDGRIVAQEEYSTDRDRIQEAEAGDLKSGGNDDRIHDEKLESFRLYISTILDNPTDAADRLKQDVIPSISDNKESSEEYFQVIYEEISYRAKSAEESGRISEAQQLWKILIDATE